MRKMTLHSTLDMIAKPYQQTGSPEPRQRLARRLGSEADNSAGLPFFDYGVDQ